MPAKYRPDQDAHRRLRHAAWKGDVRLARAMLGRGAKLEATDGDQYTPLLIAARWNRIEMVKFLLEESGARMTAKNNEGDNAYNLATLYGHTELAQYLEESGCDTTDNVLRTSRQATTDEWLAMAVRRTPTNTEISKMREKVHKNYSALEKEKTKAGKAKSPDQWSADKAASAAAVEAATGLEGEEAAKHMDADAPVGQITFPVGQRVVKKAPHACRLGIGSMGLALFDGVVPVATWPYKFIDAVVVETGRKSSKVVVLLNSGKMRKLAFQTLLADELSAAIEAKMDELAMHQANSPRWTPRAGDARVLDGGAMAPEPEPGSSDVISSQAVADSKITLDTDRSIWVGGIPESLVVKDMTASTDEIDIESSPLAKLFAEFGTIISLTARQKPGLNRSWAFITFATAVSVEQALKPGHAVKHGSVQLQVEKTNVEEQLQRAETGALAQVWQRQQAKEMEWMQSLLHGMHKDASYTAAKARVGASMGLRAEELDEELEMQEMEELRGRAVALVSGDMTDSDSESDEEDTDTSSESESSSSDSDSESDDDAVDSSLDTAQAVARRKVLAGHGDVTPVRPTADRVRTRPHADAGLGMPPSGASPRPAQALAVDV